ncbi:MAG TPA: chorismate-binding protein, partial [Actinomycetota bacterium]|nr:chorismate-binding protein [Actinomycetota bacterium]
MRARPDREAFERQADGYSMAPVWAELLADVSTPVNVFPALAGDGPGVVLESVERSERWGRYSFVAGDPAAILVLDADGLRVEASAGRLPIEAPSSGNARADLVALARSLRAPRVEGLPSLTGGLMGFLSYEAAGLLDGQPSPAGDAHAPPAGLLLVDRAVVFDHWSQRLLLIAHVPPGAYDDGVSALEELAERVSGPSGVEPGTLPGPIADGDPAGEPNMPDERYREIVGAMKEHIGAGDIYQGVPSRRVSFPCPHGGFPVYRRLRVTNPAPYMFFVRMLGLELAGSSPEPLVRVEGRRV